MAARIALTCALAVLCGGAGVGLAVVLLTDRFVQAAEDRQLSEVAGMMAFELRELHVDLSWLAQDEARELAHTAICVAISEHGKVVAGDHDLTGITAPGCRDLGPLRACGQQVGQRIAIAARDRTPAQQHRSATARAALLALAITTLVGGIASFWLARVSLKPLESLRAAVDLVPEDDPGSAELGAHSGLSEIDTVRDSLASAFARLGLSLDQTRRFARDAAHELRTPLTTLLGELELAAESAHGAMRDDILRARGVAARLSGLIDRLLILARPEATPSWSEPVELGPLVEDTLSDLTSENRARVTLEGEARSVPGDRTLLQAMLSNALDNALKYSKEPVQIALSSSATHTLVSVQDLGPGIAPDERERVFAPFYRTAGSRASRVPGHGVGLALIAHVVALHRGEARFVDCPRGARLEVRLPAFRPS